MTMTMTTREVVGPPDIFPPRMYYNLAIILLSYFDFEIIYIYGP